MDSKLTPHELRLNDAIEAVLARSVELGATVGKIVVPSLVDVPVNATFFAGAIPNRQQSKEERIYSLLHVNDIYGGVVTGIFERKILTPFDTTKEIAQLRPSGCFVRDGNAFERMRDQDVNSLTGILSLAEWDPAYAEVYAKRYRDQQFPPYSMVTGMDPDA